MLLYVVDFVVVVVAVVACITCKHHMIGHAR